MRACVRACSDLVTCPKHNKAVLYGLYKVLYEQQTPLPDQSDYSTSYVTIQSSKTTIVNMLKQSIYIISLHQGLPLFRLSTCITNHPLNVHTHTYTDQCTYTLGHGNLIHGFSVCSSPKYHVGGRLLLLFDVIVEEMAYNTNRKRKWSTVISLRLLP